ncbi:MAG: NADPH-dependent FMN reductase [Pseudomonadota bacterium]
MARVRVVGIGGALRESSTSETALNWMLSSLEREGCATSSFVGCDIDFPMFSPRGGNDDKRLDGYLEAVRNADAVVLSSPVYHGAPSGLIKNALDHLQPLMEDERAYLTGRPVLCVAAGGGLQGAVNTLSSLRDIVHALRGWPTPMQVPISSSAKPFDDQGNCTDGRLEKSLLAARDNLLSFVRSPA